ncbi:MAG: hypothetical protein ABI718_13335 [Acidobacteriota bacterium]
MKKKKDAEQFDELRESYGSEFFESAKPNRFAGQDIHFKGTRAVLLDEDVAEVFESGEAVNTVLRTTIRAMRTNATAKAKKKKIAAKR